MQVQSQQEASAAVFWSHDSSGPGETLMGPLRLFTRVLITDHLDTVASDCQLYLMIKQ